nr:MAG TPA: hypothetical protein [Microviridae sp.]
MQYLAWTKKIIFSFSSDIAILRHVCETCSKGSSSNNC